MSTKKLQERLLSITNQDPCINTKKRSSLLIDLYSFVDKKDLHKFLWSKKDKIKINNSDFQNIKNDLNSFKNSEDFINYCLINNIDISITTQKELDKNFQENKTKAINEIFKKTITTSKLFQKFKNRARAIEKEENIYPLYIASGFISGIDINNSQINMPLLLWEIDILIENGDVYLLKNNDDITVNEKALFYLNYNYNLKIDSKKIDSINNIHKIAQYLSKILTIDFDLEIKEFDNASNDHLVFNNSTVLTLIEPLGGVIKSDIELIEKRRDEPFEINKKLIDYKKIEKEVLSNQDILSINRPLNLYQKIAIRSSLERNTLIYGPPGTGKSETIASLIANIIYSEKNVLMVSEKMAALDVLEKRLSCISDIALFAFKPEHKDKFYNTLLNLEKILKNDISFDESILLKNRKLLNNSYNELLDSFKQVFNIEKKLRDKYSLSNELSMFCAIEDNEINKTIFDWYHEIFKIYSDASKLWNFYDDLRIMNRFISDKKDILDMLEKYNFRCTRKELIDFLEYFNSNNYQSWLLKNFIKQKDNYKKAPLIKSQVKNEAATIKFFEELVNLNIDEFNFKYFNYLINIPNEIKNSNDYHNHLIFYLILSNSKISFSKQANYLNEKLQQFKSLQEKIALKNAEIIRIMYLYKLKNKLLKNEKIMHDVNSVISYAHLKRRPNINVLIKENYETLRLIFPIWILSPIQTCILTPCKKNIFDYGIYDEASQMFLEKAYPLVYRCKINIVAGDDKQLQPTSFFMKKYDEEIDQEEMTSVNSGISLFEQANVSMWAKFHLKNHYRSDAAELIEFSNKYVYDNQLEYCNKNVAIKKPIEVYQIEGLWIHHRNNEEANKVIELINDPRFVNDSILIVTFNQQQANLLESKIFDEFIGTKIFDKLMNEKIKIRSLENVQGDEADIVILSISYAKDKNGKLRNFFGPLSQQGGINRLNVAITRARTKMIVVKSIFSNDVKHSDNINNNIFKEFLRFVEEKDLEVNSFDSITSENIFYNDIIESLSVKIDLSKYQIMNNYNIGKYNIDVAIINKMKNTVELAIIIEKSLKNENEFIINETINKVFFIQDMKYPVVYFSEIEWKVNKQHYMKIINDVINKT